ncbi:MAG: choice-of-anchor Q domain-containing protein [Bacteroidia bacterium]|nr:hypothetical protein [Bacteroidia bacterium]MDW8159113.1 choice-of-anchor Q domain-containing protein [Bacteroidia bacterium]
MAKSKWLWGGAILLLLFFTFCEKPEVFETTGNLAFSADTVKFDTLFTQVLSPTRRLTIYNRSSVGLEINSIFLARGNASVFDVIVNGQAGMVQNQVRINPRDSIFAFIKLKSQVEKNTDFWDALVFQFADGKSQKVILYAHVLDAYFFRDTVLTEAITVFPNDKPIVVDGYIYVAPGTTLQIMPGTELYFSSRTDFDRWGNRYMRSMIIIDGTLQAIGTFSKPVLFTNFRLGKGFRNKSYQDEPGQWQGLIFTKLSQGNRLSNAILQNGSIGVRCDSVSLTSEPKLVLENTVIKNMANFCILGLGFDSTRTMNAPPNIVATNILAFNAGQNVVGLFGGGKYYFSNCTFSSFSNFLSRSRSAVLGWTNYLKDNNNRILGRYPSEIVIQNCILWGSKEEEFITDLVKAPIQLTFTHNLVRSKRQDLPASNLINLDPLFENFTVGNYRLKKESSAIDRGIQNELTPLVDIEGKVRPRGNAPDIGAYEVQ